jgi:hypothetical protein
MRAASHDEVERTGLPGLGRPHEVPEDFETRQLDPDDPLVPDFETFQAVRERFLASVAAPVMPVPPRDGRLR